MYVAGQVSRDAAGQPVASGDLRGQVSQALFEPDVLVEVEATAVVD